MEYARGPAGDGSTAGRAELAQFKAFYDFAFPRVHRFAERRTDTQKKAEALTDLILVSSLTSLGGARAPHDGFRGDPAELAFRFFAIARRVADQAAEDPSLLIDAASRSGLAPGAPLLSIPKRMPGSCLVTSKRSRSGRFRRGGPLKSS